MAAVAPTVPSAPSARVRADGAPSLAVGAVDGRAHPARRRRPGAGVGDRADRRDRPVRGAPVTADALLTLPFAKPSGQFPLGGDFLGRDVLSRVLNGGWALLLMALAATAIGIATGAAAGMSAAYLRGKSDGLIMRTVDVILAFPQLVFALLLVSLLGPKLWLIVLAVGLTHAPAVARVIRSATLDISERDYVKVVELQGMRPAKVMTSEILPNLISPLMVEAGLRLTYSIVIMAGLAFLGFGQPPPAANWGLMINENRIGLAAQPVGGDRPGRADRPAHDRHQHVHRRRSRGSRSASTAGRRRRCCWTSSARGSPVTGGLPPQPGPARCRRRPERRGSGSTSATSRSGSARPAPTSSARSRSRCPAGRCSAWSASRVRARPRSALALLGHARRGLRISGGEVRLDGADLLRCRPASSGRCAARGSPTSRRTRRPRSTRRCGSGRS